MAVVTARARPHDARVAARLRAALAVSLATLPAWWAGVGAAARPPVLDLRAPAAMAPYAEQLRDFDTRRLLAVMRLVGLEDPGSPILVLLASRDSALAASTPEWISGYASGDGRVVLFPERAPSYPHESVEELLQHEVAHVLIARAAGGRPVPRWFHEGVALAAERTWRLGDRAQFAYEVAFAGAVPATGLDGLFEAGPASVARAYSLSGALVQDLVEQYGPDLPARVLGAMRSGQDFDRAFLSATGATVPEASDAFWRRRRLWVTWLPWVTSPATVYAIMTLLALAAVLRVRARRAARRREQEEETMPPPSGSPPDPPVIVH